MQPASCRHSRVNRLALDGEVSAAAIEDMVEQQVGLHQESLVPARGRRAGAANAAGGSPFSVSADQIRPGLRADEIIGAEVRTADDKIVGEVRNIVLATENCRNYAVVASAGFSFPARTASSFPSSS